MYDTIKNLHSYWAFIVLIILIFAVVNAILRSKKTYDERSFRIALFGLIVSHIQLLIGLILYFVSPLFDLWSSMGGEVMKNADARLNLVEHPIINILAIVLITIGFSRHKKKAESNKKYKTILIFYSLGLILLLSRIPWDVWPRF
ncbi:MAG: hypothetical protein KJO49_03880 [Bacteroidia bacterium]|nr:hypothetical protein [Bacteroidia bacterium]MBT8268621.1 hypothetical protein [Bacteroidia bacterium]NNF82930.1 hypothetical protein [Flavobacteriaceae bacterium]NNK70196.1 hypothetical protein [Flavobacteriaceae bacterium]NNL81146.1 hypothetical protein [Flavobacteriaceae bacterium]